MKIYKIIYTLFFLVVFLGEQTIAEGFSEQNAINTYRYGIVDAVYLEESRLVVSDVNLHYTAVTGFYTDSGAGISDMGNELKQGTPVKFRFYQQESTVILKDLKIVSMQEFDKSENNRRLFE